MMIFALPFFAADAALEVWLASVSAWELAQREPILFIMES